MSNLVRQIVLKVQARHPGLEAHVIASELAIVCGGIITFISLIQRGWIVEFTPLNLGLHDPVHYPYCGWPSPHDDGNHQF
jgi:hypothetical protein